MAEIKQRTQDPIAKLRADAKADGWEVEGYIHRSQHSWEPTSLVIGVFKGKNKRIFRFDWDDAKRDQILQAAVTEASGFMEGKG